jgi:hypothetical protein
VLLAEHFRARKPITVLANLIRRCALVGLPRWRWRRAAGLTLAGLVALRDA